MRDLYRIKTEEDKKHSKLNIKLDQIKKRSKQRSNKPVVLHEMKKYIYRKETD